jgi:hypothetical protein
MTLPGHVVKIPCCCVRQVETVNLDFGVEQRREKRSRRGRRYLETEYARSMSLTEILYAAKMAVNISALRHACFY